MSEHITHISVAEDSARLVFQDPSFNPELKKCIKKYPAAFQFGSCSRSGDKFILPLITKWRDDWKINDKRSEKMAYVLGWTGHLAGDRTFKPVYRITDLAYYMRGYPGPSHASVYHDAVTFSKTFQRGKTGPFHPSILEKNMESHPAADYLPVSRMEAAQGADFVSEMATFKIFLPDKIEDWEEQWKAIDKERQHYYVDVKRYTEAYHSPQPDRLRQYIVEPNFYDENDAVIQIAREVQRGQKVTHNLQEALAEAGEQSLYAQSIKLGYEFLLAASLYFDKKIDLEEAKERSRTGKRHKQKLKYYIELAEKEGRI